MGSRDEKLLQIFHTGYERPHDAQNPNRDYITAFYGNDTVRGAMEEKSAVSSFDKATVITA